MPYILDGIIVFTVLICIFLSAKKGFVFSLIEVLGFVAAIVISFTVSAPLANITYDTLLEKPIIQSIDKTKEEAETAIIDAVWNELPNFVTENNYITISKDDISIDNGNNDIAQRVSDSLVKPVSTKILSIIIATILFSLLVFLAKLLGKNFNKMFSHSAIGSANSFLGGALGLVKGIAFSMLFCLIVTLILTLSKDGFLIFKYEIINSTFIFKYLMEFLPI